MWLHLPYMMHLQDNNNKPYKMELESRGWKLSSDYLTEAPAPIQHEKAELNENFYIQQTKF